MLLAELLEGLFYGLYTSRFEIRVSLADTFNRFLIVLPLPLKSRSQNLIERRRQVFPMPMGIVIKLRPSLR
jgi:hypothetical protein